MKKITLITALVAVAAITIAASYTIMPVEAPLAESYKLLPTHLVGVGKVVAIEATDIVTDKTIILSRVDGSTTNVIATLTTTKPTGSHEVFDLSASNYFWVVRGETWLRSGTETNAAIRLILQQ